jgi:hypothetical protein
MIAREHTRRCTGIIGSNCSILFFVELEFVIFFFSAITTKD